MLEPTEVREWCEEKGITSLRDLWMLVKLCKHVRMRCRNNAAFNNFFNRIFPNATFDQVPKVNARGEQYKGLRIMMDGETIDD